MNNPPILFCDFMHKGELQFCTNNILAIYDTPRHYNFKTRMYVTWKKSCIPILKIILILNSF